MAGRILKDDVEALRRQADIVAVVGDYTTLKRAGKSFKGLCPFHTEKTPSFTATPDGNFFHCFGCGASGDIYDFLILAEGLGFAEAVERLARRTGYTLRYEQMSARERREVGERSRLVGVTQAAMRFFNQRLLAAEGQVAREYLKARGFGRADVDAFDLGYAPNAWDALSTALTAEGIAPADLITTGLALRNDRGGLRDRFRGRLIFPIHDPGGDVIGFGGRVLPEVDYGDFDPPKYLNSSETPLYKKIRVLYGVPQARAAIVRADQVLVCEGYTDVMALHQAGLTHAVATCGTAVGVEHLRMIARYASRVVLAFDADAAGVQAAERAGEAARELRDREQGAALDVRVLQLSDGQDPADLVRTLGAEGVQQALDEAVALTPFVVRHRLADADLATESGRTAALRAAIEVLGREPDLDLRREWARTEVADAIGISYEFVARTAARAGVELDTHQGVARTGARAATPGSRRSGGAGRQRARLERDILRGAIQRPELQPDEWFELTEEDFSHPTAQEIMRVFSAAGGVGIPLEALLEEAPNDELRGLLRALALEADPAVDDVGHDDPDLAAKVAADVVAGRVRRLLADRLVGEEAHLLETLARLNHVTDRDQLQDIQRRLNELQRRRRELTNSID